MTSLRRVSVSLKYAVVERERRFLVSADPDGVVAVREIVDRYVAGTRMVVALPAWTSMPTAGSYAGSTRRAEA